MAGGNVSTSLMHLVPDELSTCCKASCRNAEAVVLPQVLPPKCFPKSCRNAEAAVAVELTAGFCSIWMRDSRLAQRGTWRTTVMRTLPLLRSAQRVARHHDVHRYADAAAAFPHGPLPLCGGPVVCVRRHRQQLCRLRP